MKITKLEYQKKDKDRVNVFIDDKFVAGIGANDVLKLNLYKDKELTPEDIKNLVGQSEFGKLFNFTLNFLSFRPRSEFEIRFRLSRKTKDSKLIDQIISRLKQIGQIDDASFAKWFIDQRNTFRPKGKIALAAELRRHGIKTKVVNDANETTLAQRALKKYHGEKTREKIARFLAGRGFTWDTVESVVARFIKEE